MKNILFAFVICITPLLAGAQSETTQGLLKQFDGNGLWTAFFYKNTLRMFNQSDSKDFDEMIKNIKKLRFLLINKTDSNFPASEYKKILSAYRNESYEEIMTTRYEGRNFDVYLKDKKGSDLGTVVLVNDSSTLYIMDMIGTIDISKVTKLFSSVDQNTDIQAKIKSFFANPGDKSDRKVKGIRVE
jgi:hypothetical protein